MNGRAAIAPATADAAAERVGSVGSVDNEATVANTAHIAHIANMAHMASGPGLASAALDEAAASLAAAIEARAAGQPARWAPAVDRVPTLLLLAQRFALSPFEARLLLLAALVEREPTLARSVGRWLGGTPAAPASFELAASLIPDADRLALSPGAALRRWRLLEPAAGQPLARAPLLVDERMLFHLEGHAFVDSRLDGLVRPLAQAGHASAALLARIVAALRGAATPAACPVVAIAGGDADSRAACAAAAARALGLRLHVLQAADIPPQPAEREALARLWEREAMLLGAALLIEAGGAGAGTGPVIGADSHDTMPALRALLQTLEAVVFVTSEAPLPALRRALLRCDIETRPAAAEAARWQAALGALAPQLGGSLERTALQFSLDDAALRDATAAASAAAPAGREAAAQALWDCARLLSRRGLESLAERIDTRASWRDLVLPPAQLALLHTIAMQVRQRHRVHHEWGFAERGTRGLGIAALFAGPSGTGKTLAAEVLAGELQLDLWRVDLARLVSKYIGETERNLARVFDAAESGGAILLFDEADALFGKRSEVRDSHDRYANLEVSYLLQRVETYRGLALLTTNQKQALDPAFLRRIRFVVSFPFPDAAARRAIWEQVFPDAMPREALDLAQLSRLAVAGGHIRDIALNAAFIAASQGRPLQMQHLRWAAEAEYAKLEKPLPRAELGEWA